jgi:hypothetical protein
MKTAFIGLDYIFDIVHSAGRFSWSSNLEEGDHQFMMPRRLARASSTRSNNCAPQRREAAIVI